MSNQYINWYFKCEVSEIKISTLPSGWFHFVLDAGLKYPKMSSWGRCCHSQHSYLFWNQKTELQVSFDPRSSGYSGALPYLFDRSQSTIFGSELTIELAKLFVKDNDAVKKFNDFHVIDEKYREIEGFGEQLSLSSRRHARGLGIVRTREGNIVYTGDFKFDQSASESYATDFGRLAELAVRGRSGLLSDSANADSTLCRSS